MRPNSIPPGTLLPVALTPQARLTSIDRTSPINWAISQFGHSIRAGYSKYGFAGAVQDLFITWRGLSGATGVPLRTDTPDAPRMIGAIYLKADPSHSFLYRQGQMSDDKTLISHTGGPGIVALWQIVEWKSQIFIESYGKSTFGEAKSLNEIPKNDALRHAFESMEPLIIADSSIHPQIYKPSDQTEAKSIAFIPLKLMGQELVFSLFQEVQKPFFGPSAPLLHPFSFHDLTTAMGKPRPHTPSPAQIYTLGEQVNSRPSLFLIVDGYAEEDGVPARLDSQWHDFSTAMAKIIQETVGHSLQDLQRAKISFVRIHFDQNLRWIDPQPHQSPPEPLDKWRHPPAQIRRPRMVQVTVPSFGNSTPVEWKHLPRTYESRINTILQNHLRDAGVD